MNSKKHFIDQYENVTFSPPLERKYVVYSEKIWKYFLRSINREKKAKVVDLGCGGGTVLFSLEKEGYTNLTGVDYCTAIPENFLRSTKFVKADVLNTPFENSSFDAVVSTMVIEHINDRKFVYEVGRILKMEGVALITSVLKDKRSWYFYKNNLGERVIEPSHLREYKSKQQYVKLFANNFKILACENPRLKYPIIDPLFRLFFRLTKLPLFKDTPTRNFFLKNLRSLRIPIPGYYSIEILVKKVK